MEIPPLKDAKLPIEPSKQRRLSDSRRSRYSFASPPDEFVYEPGLSMLDNRDEKDIISKENINHVLYSDNINTLKQFNFEIRSLLEKHPTILDEISKDQEIVDDCIKAISLVTTGDGVETYCKCIYPFFKRNTVGFIDGGLLFNLRERLSVFPFRILDFIEVIPVLSGYARDAMISLGIIDDIIDFFLASNSPTEQVACAKVLMAQFTIPDPFQVEQIKPLIPKIVSMLSCNNIEALNLVYQTLSEINGRHQLFTADFLDLGVHEYLSKHIDDPKLVASCFTLAGNMSICEPEDIKKMVDCGLIDKYMKMTDEHPIDTNWCLSNCFESSPKELFLILKDFIPKQIKKNTPQTTGFVATVLLFATSINLPFVLQEGGLQNVLSRCDSTDDDLVAKCLDAIARILILSHTKPAIGELVKGIIVLPEYVAKINVTKEQSTDTLVKEVATQILEHISNIKQ